MANAAIVAAYVRRIERGAITLEDVHPVIRADVQAMMEAKQEG